MLCFVLVQKGNYQQGTGDGRVEQWQVSSSGTMLRHGKDGITISNPYNSWCSNVDDADKFLTVRFIERRMITGFIAQGDQLEEKWVSKAEVKYQDENNNWVHARTTNDKIVSITLFLLKKLESLRSTGQNSGMSRVRARSKL